MTSIAQRQILLTLIAQAVCQGARLHRACAQINLSVRSVQRWQQPHQSQGDRRLSALRTQFSPPNKFSALEREAAMCVPNSDKFNDLPPSQIVPRLADEGGYVGSESTLYRLLRMNEQASHRRLECPPKKTHKPPPLVARQADQIYCWDITYLPTQVRGMFFYLYLFVDLFSRKIVGWQVFDRESATLGAGLLHDICQRQGIEVGQLTVHSDNGGPMKGEAMMSTMQRLGVAQTRSRPSVSNDNAFSESLFRTLKYRPELPVKPFEDLWHARRWATRLVNWYNFEHCHSAIGFVTPAQRHAGLDEAILKARTHVYEQARQMNPWRWSGRLRNWASVTEVHLNPDSPQTQEQKNRRKVA